VLKSIEKQIQKQMSSLVPQTAECATDEHTHIVLYVCPLDPVTHA